MKRILLILFLFSSSISLVYSQSGWFQQSPLPTGSNLYSIKFVNSTTGFIAGASGTILKTTNAGQLWLIKNSNANYSINSIDFFDVNTGLAVCINSSQNESVILKTTDGGETWYQPVSSIHHWLWSIDCTLNNSAFIVCDSGIIYKTTNLGNSWFGIYTGFNYSLSSASFLNDSLGYITGLNGLILKTTNGGLNWIQQVSQGQSPLKSTYFINPNTGYIVGGFIFSSIQKTTNGGNNWFLQSSPGRYLFSVNFFDVNSGYAVGNDGTILRTINAGDNWNLLNTNLTEWLFGVYSVNPSVTYLVGQNGTIEMTSDGGISWISQFYGSVYTLNSICFPSINTGYSIGGGEGNYGRALIKTTNGGLNWLYKDLPGNDIWQKVYFVNIETGFVIGGNGKIFKTTNEGVDWFDYSINIGDLLDINFIDPNFGFGIGSKTFKTTNGGNNWIILSDTGGFSIKFLNTETGYVISSNSIDNYTIKKTTNGGFNWITQYSNSNNNLVSMFFLNENTGFACSNFPNSFILKTSNGGNNWQSIFTDSLLFPELNCIWFVNINTGYCVGSYNGVPYTNGYIIKTTNSGQNWSLLDTMQNGLNSIFFVNDSVGYSCGQAGLILKTTTGGAPIGIKPISNSIPTKFILYQNYPNPFNSVTKIKYQIPSTSYIKLIIYDILGREVKKLVNNKQEAGIYQVEWDASNFSSSIYFYKLVAGDFIDSKKIVLLK